MMKNQAILILAVIILSGCGPLRIMYELSSNSSNSNEICCSENCLQKIEVFSRTVHYQNGTNYLWIEVKSDTGEVELVNVFSRHFSYQLLEKKSDADQGIYVYENTEKIKYHALVKEMKNEELTLAVRLSNLLCQEITLKPIID